MVMFIFSITDYVSLFFLSSFSSFNQNLRRKRETMRRLSESNRAAASASALASASASTSASAPFVATPAKAGVDHKEGARRTALLFACSTLEEQAVFLLAPEYQQTHG